MTKSTSPKPLYSVVPVIRPRISAACASACSSVIFCLPTSAPSCARVTSSALRRPRSTNSCLTSLRITGTPAEAMTWAISPPIVPAPTTAALNTNTLAELLRCRWERPGGRRRLRRELAIGGKLDREPLEGAPQRLAQRVTDEEDIGDRAAETRALELVDELERHVAAAV